jgi:hypothetical protein
VAGLKGQIAKVGQFFNVLADPWPYHHFTVLASRSGSGVAGYGTRYTSDQTILSYIFLPQLKSNAQAALQVLQYLEVTYPGLFPESAKRKWLEAAEFLLPEERKGLQEVKEITAEFEERIRVKKAENQKLAEANSFIRELLVANEGLDQDPSLRLSSVVRRALEFVGFSVEDIDQKTKSAIKKEDFWVIDGDYLAITEVSGTAQKNPKIKEFNDILGRITTIYKRRGDLELPDGANVRGLLVLNYDMNNHPTKRPKIYSGDDQHISQAAIEQGIGLLSTVELHKIIVSVKEGIISKSDAREILKQPGRIEFAASRAAAK